jgi:hypothetical protein
VTLSLEHLDGDNPAPDFPTLHNENVQKINDGDFSVQYGWGYINHGSVAGGASEFTIPIPQDDLIRTMIRLTMKCPLNIVASILCQIGGNTHPEGYRSGRNSFRNTGINNSDDRMLVDHWILGRTSNNQSKLVQATFYRTHEASIGSYQAIGNRASSIEANMQYVESWGSSVVAGGPLSFSSIRVFFEGSAVLHSSGAHWYVEGFRVP